MADPEALSVLENQQRPCRRLEKTYGKKKGSWAPSRDIHYDLFGGGDENAIVEKMDQLTVKEHSVKPSLPTVEKALESTQKQKAPTRHNPHLRGRRKPTSKKMATLGPNKMQSLAPLLSLVDRTVQDFQEFGRSMGRNFVCTKLGEGAFADVFELRPKDPDEAIKVEERGGLVIKVIPFSVEKSTDTDDIVDLDSITREVQLLLALDRVHGFARCRGVHVVSGSYPDVLLEAFRNFKATGTPDAQNRDPTEAFSSDQTYVLIEMDHAGKQMGSFPTLSAFQAYDIFWKTAMILASAEESVEFEHRDLHTGNICCKPRVLNGPTDIEEEVVQSMTEEPKARLGLSNLHITVIDYTLSRAKVQRETGEEVIIADPIKYWEDNDIVGTNASDQRQFNTYRKVRDWARAVEAKVEALAEMDEDSGGVGVSLEKVDKYQRFLPKTNVMWLWYLVKELLARKGRAVAGSSGAARRLQTALWRKLETVSLYLDAVPTLMPEDVAELLASAIGFGWLSQEDVAAYKAELEE
ncbi:hypothetical protein PV08_05748 [Exophiala spinifera]|uniref:Protein kinase domain-containing protein n=1 Tax=Exophiala spinifera TaxID=91928 RepID=A0A0D2B9P7_9EURO|nr:uncharacterized protein PV08_05748 [Exophiala spinifera]KIW15698.1 hypothetical protein PV08_05748 [Exophiala spinifera]